MPATDDPELARLLDESGQAEDEMGGAHHLRRASAFRRQTALLAYLYLAAQYVRRDRLYDDGPWAPGDGSAYGAAQASQS